MARMKGTASEEKEEDETVVIPVGRSDVDAVTVLSSFHGRQRRQERNIAKRDLQMAIKYGTKEPGAPNKKGQPTWKYTFGDVVYITDYKSQREITSWAVQGCGIDIGTVAISAAMQRQHDEAVARLAEDLTAWTSHTVAVVDQSGSMRKTDASEGASRSDVVWLVLALDFVARRLNNGESAWTDTFSLVSMRNDGRVLLRHEPMDWLLYNRLVQFLRESPPLGDGNYVPALEKAEELLQLNKHGSCALALLFFSDGRPSDKTPKSTGGRQVSRGVSVNPVAKLTTHTGQRVAHLASAFGRRLSVGAFAIGPPGVEDFSTLKVIAQTATDYGAQGTFQSATLSVAALSKSITYLSSCLSVTRSELTHASSATKQQVRDVQRETKADLAIFRAARKHRSVAAPTTAQEVLHGNSNSVNERFWIYVHNRFANDPFRRTISRTVWTKNGWQTLPRALTFQHPQAIAVALKRRYFGEGVERLVREFREVDNAGRFVGDCWVAKESRFVSDVSVHDVKKFHTKFCRTQHLAQRLADKFNERLQNLPIYNAAAMPLVKFLDCCVYMLNHVEIANGRCGVLVEKMLDVHAFPYIKWNNNNGYVYGRDTDTEDQGAQPNEGNHAGGIQAANKIAVPGEACHAIQEGDEEEDDDDEHDQVEHDAGPGEKSEKTARETDANDNDGDDDSDHDFDDFDNDGNDDDDPFENDGDDDSMDDMQCRPIVVTQGEEESAEKEAFNVHDVPQAFSCFTYRYSKRKMMVCDLQGVLNTSQSPPVFEMTDPAIHFRSSRNRRHVYGRTDLGLEGIHSFFETHKHTELCRMLHRRWLKVAPKPEATKVDANDDGPTVDTKTPRDEEMARTIENLFTRSTE